MIHRNPNTSCHLSTNHLTSIHGGYTDRSFRRTFIVVGHNSKADWWNVNSSNSHDPMPSSSSSLPFIITSTIISLAIAEILNHCGIFHDQTGLEATRRKHNILTNMPNDFDSAMEYTLDEICNWWIENRFQKGGILQWSTWRDKVQRGMDLYTARGFLGSLQCLCFKHQFAVGSAIGMMCQGISRSAIYTTFMVFVAGEILQNITKESVRVCHHDSWDDSSIGRMFHPNPHGGRHNENNDITKRVIALGLECIEKMRSAMRQSMNSLIEFLNCTDEDFDNSIGTVIVGIGFGLVAKTIF